MAIEPLGSIMAMQAQPIQHAQTQQVQRQEVVNTEVNPVQKPEQNIDPSIMTVANTGETPEKNAYNSDGENGYSEENTKQQNEKIKKAVFNALCLIFSFSIDTSKYTPFNTMRF